MHRIIKRSRRYFGGDIYFRIGCLVTLMVVVISDGRALMSDSPQLYWILDVPRSVSEETALYMPYISNFEITDPFRLDYTWPSQESWLAPYPYIALLIMWIAKYLSLWNISVAIYILHLLIVLKYVFASYVVGHFAKDKAWKALCALFLTFAPIYTLPDILSYAWALLLFLPVGALIRWRHHKKPLEGPWQYMFRIVCGTGFLYRIYMLYTGHPYVGDLISLRVINPLISSLFFYGTLAYIVYLGDALENNTHTRPQIMLWAIIFVANFYVYYLNYLLLAPVVLLLCVWYRKKIWRLKGLLVVCIIAWVCAVPFLISIYQSKHVWEIHDLRERASLLLCESCVPQNYPFTSKSTLLFYILLWVSIVAPYAHMRWKTKSVKWSFAGYSMLILACAWLIIYAGNYIIKDFVPQPILMYRYRIPLICLAYLPFVGPGGDRYAMSTRKWRILLSILLIWLASFTLLQGLGKYNVLTQYMQPANEHIYKDFESIKQYIPRDSIVVSNYQAYTILAPVALGVKTFQPSAISTVWTHMDIIRSYMIQAKLLGYTQQQVFEYLTYTDSLTGEFIYFAKGIVDLKYGKATPGISREDKLIPTYPMSYERVVETSWKDIRKAYDALSIEDIIEEYPHITFVMVNDDIPEQIKPFCILKANVWNIKIYETVPME